MQQVVRRSRNPQDCGLPMQRSAFFNICQMRFTMECPDKKNRTDFKKQETSPELTSQKLQLSEKKDGYPNFTWSESSGTRPRLANHPCSTSIAAK